jgi:thiamine pyrophosphokinase
MKAVVIGNGEARIGPRLHALLREAALVVCADGGAAHALAAGVRPQVIVGDMDSLDPAVLAHWEAQGVEVLRYPAAKDETDLELAIGCAVARGADEVALLATLGGRLDQALANVLLLTSPALGGVALRLEEEETSAVALRGGGGSLTIEGRAGDTVSLLPLSAEVTGVTTARLRYPLRAEPLLRGPTRGVSNEMEEATAEVRVESGLLLVVHLHGTGGPTQGGGAVAGQARGREQGEP